MLNEINFHERDKRIQFFEEGHIYDIDGNRDFTSVTTLISQHHDKFDADKIIKKMRPKIAKDPNHKYAGKTDEQIKKEWNESGKLAATLGTKMHYNIECFYNSLPMPDENAMIELYHHFKEFHEKVIIPKGYKAYRTEWFVFDEILKLAGSIDMIYQDKDDPDLLHIYDWKRTKGIEEMNKFNNMLPPVGHLPDSNFWHYSLQLNIYRYILMYKYKKKVGSMYLVVLHENNDNFQLKEVPRLEREVQEIMNMRMMQFSNS